MTPEPYGLTPGGDAVTAYTLVGPDGTRLRVLDLGATAQALWLPDGTNILLGYADAAGYFTPDRTFFGATIGRFANRIARSAFVLDGQAHQLAPNEGATCLHGGAVGWDQRIWTVADLIDEGPTPAITFELVSSDGDQGFPGEVTARATYRLVAGGVDLEYEATTTAPTVVSMTNHAYVNLLGEGVGSIDGHVLTLDADHYLPVDAESIPLGRLAHVAGTPFDFRHGALIGPALRSDHPDVAAATGIDHAFALACAPAAEGSTSGLWRAARVEALGRWFEVHTDRPSLQVYTGNGCDGSHRGTSGSAYRQGDGVALETQVHPDCPNQPELGDATLRPGETYRARTSWRFGTSNGSKES